MLTRRKLIVSSHMSPSRCYNSYIVSMSQMNSLYCRRTLAFDFVTVSYYVSVPEIIKTLGYPL